MSVNDDKDLIGIENASKIAKHLREYLASNCEVGVTTQYLDSLCKKEMKAIGAKSAPMVFYNAPSYSFYSLNNKVVHGLPTNIQLQNGDLLKIDVTPIYEGYISDTACTVIIGGMEKNTIGEKLIKSTIESFNEAIKFCKNGTKVNLLGKVIEEKTIKNGFFVIKELSGHGVGREVHEEPSVLNYFDQSYSYKLKTGLVIAIEPMIVNRKSLINEEKDGWTLKTKSGTLTAHYEHTILITDNEPIVLTA
jgi:methionyl aminopeptidase